MDSITTFRSSYTIESNSIVVLNFGWVGTVMRLESLDLLQSDGVFKSNKQQYMYTAQLDFPHKSYT